MNRKITCRLTYFNVTLGKSHNSATVLLGNSHRRIGTLHITYHNFIKSIKGLKYFAKMFRRIIRVYNY